MLILTRKTKESIIIGDNIRITILGVKGNHVRVGIEAPEDIPVHRQEVYLRSKIGVTNEQFPKADTDRVSG